MHISCFFLPQFSTVIQLFLHYFLLLLWHDNVGIYHIYMWYKEINSCHCWLGQKCHRKGKNESVAKSLSLWAGDCCTLLSFPQFFHFSTSTILLWLLAFLFWHTCIWLGLGIKSTWLGLENFALTLTLTQNNCQQKNIVLSPFLSLDSKTMISCNPDSFYENDMTKNVSKRSKATMYSKHLWCRWSFLLISCLSLCNLCVQIHKHTLTHLHNV